MTLEQPFELFKTVTQP